MRLLFLGTGTSFGVPVIGCRCSVCASPDPRNRRSRHCLALEQNGRLLLVDVPPELRLQLLSARIDRVDGVFLTHMHADHVHGIDDLRVFSMRSGSPLPMFVAREHADELRDRFPYIFDQRFVPGPGINVPEIELRTFEAGESIVAAGLRLRPLAFPHGETRSYGFRAGPLGVIVDGKQVPPQAEEVLRGVDVLVINALWWGDPHPTHFNVEEAVAVARRLGAARTFLTHLTHRLEHAQLSEQLPEGVFPAHDGLVLECEA